MTTFRMMVLALAVLYAACVAPRTYTEEEKLVLGQTKSIWVEADGDYRNTPAGTAGIIDKVETHVKEKLTRSGLTVTTDKRSADADLRLEFDFAYKRSREEPTSSDTESTRNLLVLHITTRLTHKDVGPLFQRDEAVPPPYDLNFPKADIIRYVDSDVLHALFKSTSPASRKE